MKKIIGRIYYWFNYSLVRIGYIMLFRTLDWIKAIYSSRDRFKDDCENQEKFNSIILRLFLIKFSPSLSLPRVDKARIEMTAFVFKKEKVWQLLFRFEADLWRFPKLEFFFLLFCQNTWRCPMNHFNLFDFRKKSNCLETFCLNIEEKLNYFTLRKLMDHCISIFYYCKLQFFFSGRP